ncbi:DsrE family protein [Marinomonas ostreistagni]|uniref:DsrE family protein n=1 Tax=Marinomonas ostreistagni TaxID=359209 RepID=UPI0019505EA2|nr:DsrE family protein [Marinomonas ostreistagni]MBM6549591.1 DsrE family protein [Marinomonas ostreistagni]
MKDTLIYLSSSPYQSTAAKEALDLALVLGTFEQPVSLCVTGDALAILSDGQAPSQRHGKHLFKLLDGLEFYDIENVYVRDSEISQLSSPLWSGVQALSDEQWHTMLQQPAAIYRF